MKIKEVLQRDPGTHGLVNNGQARIVNDPEASSQDELRGELATFVCEGQYANGIRNIVDSYIKGLGQTSQRAAWVSGFFGSGKSHLLKMLCHLWADTKFPDGATARSLVPALPDDLKAVFRELDTAGRRAGGLIAAAGTLPSGNTELVRHTMLSVLLRSVGLPGDYPSARFCLWLHSEGHYETVTQALQADGCTLEEELTDLHVSPALANAVLKAEPSLASSTSDMLKLFAAQFPPLAADITTEDFLRVAKEALLLAGKDGKMPCTLIVLDEVQQYIGDSNDRSVLVTDVAEALAKQFDSHVMLVGAGQAALTGMPLLQKMMDRFTIRVQLSDVEVEAVTRKVLLQKQPSKVGAVKQLLETHAGEISRQLQGTRIAERTEDKKVAADDYPLLPVRRRFWEHCFRQIDSAGTQSQLRSQLRIIHDAVAKLSNKPLGAVVPADELYDALAPEMVNTGVLLREINERIIAVGEQESPLARRICSLVFLIGRMRTEGAADIGVRATKEHIADLLVDDLNADNGALRTDVSKTLDKLASSGALLRVGDEYRLQTREGAEWDQEFRARQSKLKSDEGAIGFKREQLLYGALEKSVKTIKLLQGDSKEPRPLVLFRDQTPPPIDGQSIPLWVRDGWSTSEKELQSAAREAGGDSPIIFVHIGKKAQDDLRRLIVDTDAAEQTLHTKGNPGTDEGREARQSMESRYQSFKHQRDQLVEEIVGAAKVFQGGGSEDFGIELPDRIQSAAEASLVRLFPRFREADSRAWPAVIERAKKGAEHPFEPLGHSDATEKHPVCQQVLNTIGSGKTGTDIRKALKASPYGWPQDGIDAALLALHYVEHITATLNGSTVGRGELDQGKIAKAEFRVERTTVSVTDKLAIRKLISTLMSCKPNEEAEKAGEFLAALLDLGHNAGGQAPLPEHPPLTQLEDIQALHGNERLVALKENANTIEKCVQEWKDLKDLADKRLPNWDLAQRLAKQAQDLEGAQPHIEQLKAVQEQRLLLEPTDPVEPVLKALAELLRKSVDALHKEQTQRYESVIAELDANDTWQSLDASDRNKILSDVGLRAPVSPDVSTDKALASHLEAHSIEATRAVIDAIPSRQASAVQQAAKRIEPKVQTVRVERTTIRNAADVQTWLERQKQRLLKALADGPVLID